MNQFEMTPEEFSAIRKRLHLSKKDLGIALGYQGTQVPDMIRRIENGGRNITRPISALMRYMDKFGVMI